MNLYVFPSIRIKDPFLLREKILQTYALPLPCLEGGGRIWYQKSYLLFARRRKYLITSHDSRLNLLSWIHKTFEHPHLSKFYIVFKCKSRFHTNIINTFFSSLQPCKL